MFNEGSYLAVKPIFHKALKDGITAKKNVKEPVFSLFHVEC